MYNRHYILLPSMDEDEAINQVEHYLDNFGDENNWYDIIRVVDYYDSNNNSYINEVIGEINNYINSIDSIKQKINTKCLEMESGSDEASYNYYLLSNWYRKLAELIPHKKYYPYNISTFDDIENIFGFEFDVFGITNLIYGSKYSEKIYLIEVDMHS